MAQIGSSSSEYNMSYNNKKSVTGPYLVYLKGSSSALTTGDAIPYALVTGTSGHGVTVSNGVVTLPAGEWICYATADTDSINDSLEAKWYIDSTLNTDFPHIIINAYTSITFYTDMKSAAYTTSGGVTIELRLTSADVTTSSECDLVIYG
jgi:hypothetical protein